MSELLPDRQRFRAADNEREAVVEALHRHSAAGRLDLDELTERVGRALSAKTLGELDELLSDLPAVTPPPRRRAWWRRPLVLIGGELAVIDAFFVTIWLRTSHGGGFWPGWIILVTSFVFARRALREQLRAARRAAREEQQQR